MKDNRHTPLEMSPEAFREAGHQLVDLISGFLKDMRQKPVTTGEAPGQVRRLLGGDALPQEGQDASDLLSTVAGHLFDHSLFNGHPKFLGYITSSPAPIGALADLLAAVVNPNVGAYILSPVATEIEKQTIRWLAEFIGVSANYGGILVSGGNMANFTGFLAGRNAKAPKEFKESGLPKSGPSMTIYCSKTTHTWIEKAAVLFGHGKQSIRWIPALADNKMNLRQLRHQIEKDLEAGHRPIMVIGTAGDVSTGAVDDLSAIANICDHYDLWFHVDGAYGVPAAAVPEIKALFEGLERADSIALDPHKWLYIPLEAGCTLVKDPNHLTDAFSSQPEYYNFNKDKDHPQQNYYEFGLQNSRGFRALKVWLALQQIGQQGYIEMIKEDVTLSELFFDLAKKHPELEAVTQNLSITTLRYVPLETSDQGSTWESYLNTLNETLVNRLQQKGEVFLSNAIVREKYCLRGCIVNFRTSEEDIREIIELVVREGRMIHKQLRREQQSDHS